MAEEATTAPDAPAGETAPPADPPTPPTAPAPAEEGTLTIAQATELREQTLAAEERARVHEAAEAELKKQIDDLKAGHTSQTDQSAKAQEDLILENGKLRAMLKAHTGGRLNLDSEIRFVNADGVTVKDGKLEGEFSYRPLSAAASPSTQPSREERQAQTSGAGSLPETRHVVPGVSPDKAVV